MANEIRYYQTPFTFISPVRHFKANDPYYYEVDNIPVKQLEESQNFLKDQVDGIIARQNNKQEIEIDRSGFSELKPFATGNDRKVKVKPGKFSARINNAFALTPLQVIQQIGGFSNTRNADGTISDLNTYQVQTNIGTAAAAVLEEFQKGLLGNALNMNGLAERAFVFPFFTESGFHLAQGIAVSGTDSPGYSQFDGDFDADERPLYPNFIGAILKHSTPETTRNLTLIKNVFDGDENTDPQGTEQGRLESEFIKRWRGAIRTSIVDVPEQLEITVPDFDENDFFFLDSAGTKQTLAANQRIDLLFIYSKGVDEESTTIPKFDSNGNPTNLTTATLGILKGAGIGVSRQTSVNSNNTDDRVNLQTLDGVPIMLAHPGDENGTNNGFATSAGIIRGSFPSPDDLMNLAPALSEQLETAAFQLIGQSILPIAYIRVQADSGPIADLITEEDIIDIRPFFRTTELAYNERAGIAAAMPQASIANPVVTEAGLERVRKEVYTDLDDRLGAIEGSIVTVSTNVGNIQGPGNSGARTIAAGNVLGGYWGPEGALIKQAKRDAAGGLREAQMNQLVDLVESEFGYPEGSIPFRPNWDKAKWYSNGQFTGDQICDHINVGNATITEFAGPDNDVKYLPPWQSATGNQQSTVDALRTQFGFDPYAIYSWGIGRPGLLPEPTFSPGGRRGIQRGLVGIPFGQIKNINARNIQVNFVTKRIKLNLDATPWVKDYHVKVNLLHCNPLGQGEKTDLRQTSNVWVQEFKDHFVICVAWAGGDLPLTNAEDHCPWKNRNLPRKFAGFVMPQMPIISNGTFSQGGSSKIKQSLNLSQSEADRYFNVRLGENSHTSEPNFFNTLVPVLYPSVQWEVIGVADDYLTNSLGPGRTKMREKDPTVICS